MTFTRTLMDQNPSRFAYALTENRNKLSSPMLTALMRCLPNGRILGV